MSLLLTTRQLSLHSMEQLLSLTTSPSGNESTFIATVTTYVQQHTSDAQHDATAGGRYTAEQLQTVVDFTTKLLATSSSITSEDTQSDCILLLKLLTRTRIHFPQLYTITFLQYLVNNIQCIVDQSNLTDSERESSSRLSLECSKLLLNLLVLQHATVLTAIQPGSTSQLELQVYETLLHLTNALAPTTTSHPTDAATADEQIYILLRIVFYLVLDTRIAKEMIVRSGAEQSGLYVTAVKLIVHYTPLPADADGNIAQQPTASHFSVQYRQTLSTVFKLLLNTTSDDSAYLSTIDQLDEELAVQFTQRVRYILAAGTSLPRYVQRLLREQMADAEQDSATPLALSTSQPAPTDSYTQQLIDDLQAEQATNSPAQPSLRQVKIDLTTLLVYAAPLLAGAIEQNAVSVQGIVNLLHQNLVAAVVEARQAQTLIVPIAAALHAVAKCSTVIRRHIKICVFRQYAYTSASTSSASNQQMVADGALSEREVDADSYTLRSLLTRQLTSLHTSIKTPISELLWLLCDEDSSEYIRLCGFGNAVGWLHAKQLPGFVNVQQRAHDVDELLQQGKKL